MSLMSVGRDYLLQKKRSIVGFHELESPANQCLMHKWESLLSFNGHSSSATFPLQIALP